VYYGGGRGCLTRVPAPCGSASYTCKSCLNAGKSTACKTAYYTDSSSTSTPASSYSTTSSSSSSGSSIPSRIYSAAMSYKGTSTANFEHGGRVACAFAVNNVMTKAGLQKIGSNPNYVPSVESALLSGRGTQITASQAVPGDIAIAPGQAHVGICITNGCTQIISNSSSRQAFVWVSSGSWDGYYGGGSGTKIYRVRS